MPGLPGCHDAMVLGTPVARTQRCQALSALWDLWNLWDISGLWGLRGPRGLWGWEEVALAGQKVARGATRTVSTRQALKLNAEYNAVGAACQDGRAAMTPQYHDVKLQGRKDARTRGARGKLGTCGTCGACANIGTCGA